MILKWSSKKKEEICIHFTKQTGYDSKNLKRASLELWSVNFKIHFYSKFKIRDKSH